MKIGVFSNYYPPDERGGAELVAQRVADELTRRGHDVFVVTTQPFVGWASLRPQITEQHVQRIYRFFPFNIYHLSRASQFSFPVRLLWHIIDLFGPHPHTLIDRVLKEEEPDVVLTHNLKGMGVRSARCIQQAGIRHIHTIHDIQLSVASGLLIAGQEQAWMQRTWLRRLYEKMAMWALGQPEVVVSPSQFLLSFYQTRGFFPNSQCVVLPNPAPVVTEENQPAQISETCTRFFYVGQLESHKGIELLLEAVKVLDLPYELHIAGDGSLAQMVLHRAQQDPRIFYHGFISLEHIKKILARTDAVVLPSVCYENSPTVMYEAFQAGVPVIASCIGGIPERITQGVNGWLFTPGDGQALTQALQQFVLQRDDYKTRRDQIRRDADVFSLHKYVDHLEGLLSGKS